MDIIRAKENRIITILLCLYAATIFMFNGQSNRLILIYLTYGILVSFLAVYLLRVKELKINIEIIFLIGYLLFGIISVLWSPNISLTLSRAKAIFMMLLLCILINNLNAKHPIQIYVLTALIVGGIAETVYFFISYGYDTVVSVFQSGIRPDDSGINNVNALANTLIIGLIAAFSYALLKKKYLFLIALIPELFLLLVFQSRTALIALIVSFLICWHYFFQQRKASKLKRFVIILSVIVLVILVIRQTSEIFGVFKRFSGLFSFFEGQGEGTKATSLETRSAYIKYGFEEFLSSPLVGVGLGNAGHILQTVYGRDTYLHNNFIEILASGGIIGFVLYYGFYVAVFAKHIRLLRKKPSAIVIASFCTLCAELISHIGIVTYYSKVSYFAFALWLTVIGMPEKLNGSDTDGKEESPDGGVQ